MPTTLAMLLAEFMRQHAQENLATKTVERYREMIAYIAPELLALNMTKITPLHLSREWSRLLKCGGHTRNNGAPRPMKPKTVRNIAGLVSSAFARAIKWGLAATNPVTHSDLPRVRRRMGMACFQLSRIAWPNAQPAHGASRRSWIFPLRPAPGAVRFWLFAGQTSKA